MLSVIIMYFIKVSLGYYRSVTLVLQGVTVVLQGVRCVIQGKYRVVSRLLQRYYRDVADVLQGCYIGLTQD